MNIITDAIESPTHREFLAASLHAAAQMGAVQALPAIENVESDPANPYWTLAIAARARIAAENAGRSIASRKTRPAAKVRAFFAALPFDLNHLNVAVGYQHDLVEMHFIGVGLFGYQPAEVFAMRELADMIYQDPQGDYLSLSTIRRVDFAQDYPSNLKVCLARMSRQKEVADLVDKLCHAKIEGGPRQVFEQQLLVEKDRDAARPIMARLQEMEQNPGGHKWPNFANLFDVLHRIGDVGDSGERAMFEHFLQNPGPAKGASIGTLSMVHEGVEVIPGY